MAVYEWVTEREQAIKKEHNRQCDFWTEHAENAIEAIKTAINDHGAGSKEHQEASETYKAIADLALA